MPNAHWVLFRPSVSGSLVGLNARLVDCLQISTPPCGADMIAASSVRASPVADWMGWDKPAPGQRVLGIDVVWNSPRLRWTLTTKSPWFRASVVP